MKFRFPLERLKRVRAIEERIARAAWASAEQSARDCEDAVENQRSVIADGRADAGGAADGTVSGASAELDRLAIDHLIRVLVARRESALTARGQADRAGDAWRSRERDRRGLEELEQRLKTRFRRENEQAEARELDEIALARSTARGRRQEFDSSQPPGDADDHGPRPR